MYKSNKELQITFRFTWYSFYLIFVLPDIRLFILNHVENSVTHLFHKFQFIQMSIQL